MRREQPLIGRQVEDEDAARGKAAAELAERPALRDGAVAEEIGAEDRGEGGVGERERVGRADADGTARLCPRCGAGIGIEVEPDRGRLRERAAQAREQPAGTAAGIEHPSRCGLGRAMPCQGGEEMGVKAAEPPHRVLDGVQPFVFGAFQTAAS